MRLKSGEPYLFSSGAFRVAVLIAILFFARDGYRLYAGEDTLTWRGGHQVQKKVLEEIPTDRVTVFDTLAPKESYRRIVDHYSSKAFNYDDKQVNRLSVWERISKRVGQFLNSLFPKWSVASHNIVIYLITVVGVLALIFVVRRVIFSGNKIIRREKKESHESEIQFIERNLDAVEIDEYVEKAIRDGNLELAIRYLYLSVLQALSHKGIIKWDHRKTNDDFLSEVKDGDLRKKFREISLIFDYVWFGKFEIDEAQFDQFKNEMINFKNQMSS